MAQRRAVPGWAEWVLPVLGFAVPAAGAAAACAVGSWAVGPNYDGVLSIVNLLFLFSSCVFVVFLVAAPVAFWWVRENLRDRRVEDELLAGRTAQPPGGTAAQGEVDLERG